MLDWWVRIWVFVKSEKLQPPWYTAETHQPRRTLTSELFIFIKGCIYLGTTFVNRICWEFVDERIAGHEHISVEHLTRNLMISNQGKQCSWTQKEEWKRAQSIKILNNKIYDLTELDTSLWMEEASDRIWCNGGHVLDSYDIISIPRSKHRPVKYHSSSPVH